MLMASTSPIVTEVQARIDKFVRGLETCNQRAAAFANNLQSTIGDDPFASMQESLQGMGRDFRQITQGIILAQGFYRLTNAVQSATSAIWGYTDSLNAAQVAFGNLFNNYDLAQEFVAVLQEYATRSPFDFTDVESAAQALRAYGIESQNLMFVIEGIGNLAAVTGNYSETFSRVARAIGQINTRGKLMGEEMRQLAEAGLDVDAVYQRLGITAGNVADANIDAATAINAIIDVLNENYGDAVAAANTTMSGILANLRDLALSVISSIIQPIYDAIHSMLYTISVAVNEFQAVFQASGLGAAISATFGGNTLAVLQNFLAIAAELGQSLLQVLYPALRIIGQALLALITAATPVIAVISQLLSFIGTLINAILNNATAMRILQGVLLALAAAFIGTRIAAAGMMIMQLITNVVNGVATVVIAAASGLRVMSAALVQNTAFSIAAGKGWATFAASLNINPIVLAISAIAALVAALFGLRSILGGVSDVAANMTSFDPNNFLSSIPAASGDINKFNNRLENTNTQLSDVADGLSDAGKAAEKAVEGLLSFDEVFSLPDQNDPTLDGSGLGDIGDLGNIEMPDFGDIGADIPEVPLFDWEKLLGYDQLTGIWDAIVEWFKNLQWPDIAGYITSGITAALSTIGFGTIGSTFAGLFSGAITSETLWTTLASPNTWKTLFTSLKNGIVAGLLSMGMDFVFDQIAQMLRDSGATMAGDVVDAISGPLSSALAVGIVTKNPFAAVGAGLVSLLFQSFEDGLETGDWTGLATSITSTMGVVLPRLISKSGKGSMLGIGGAIAGLVFGSISDSLESSGNTEGAEIANKVGTILSTTLNGAAIGAAFGPVGAAVGAAVGGILGTVISFWDEISAWWTGTAWPAISSLGETIGGAFEGIATTLSEWWDGVTEFFGGIGESITGFGSDIIEGLGEGISSGWSSVSTFFTELPGNIGNFFSGAGSWLTETGSNILDGLGSGAETAWNTVSGFFKDIPGNIGDFFNGAGELLTSSGENILEGLGNGAESIWNNVGRWFDNLPDNITGVFSGSSNWLTSGGRNLISGFKNAVTNTWSSVKSWFRNIPNLIKNIFSGASSWLRSAGSDIVNGLWKGLKSGWDWICDQVSGWGSWLANIKGPESYDRQLLVPNGEWITSGLLEGLTKDIPKVYDVMHGLGPMMAEAFQAPTLAVDPQEQTQPHVTGYNTGQKDAQIVANPYLTDQSAAAPTPIVYVQTLIADKQGLRDLQKQLDIVKAESDRWR